MIDVKKLLKIDSMTIVVELNIWDFYDGYRAGVASVHTSFSATPDMLILDFAAWYVGFKKGKELSLNF